MADSEVNPVLNWVVGEPPVVVSTPEQSSESEPDGVMVLFDAPKNRSKRTSEQREEDLEIVRKMLSKSMSQGDIAAYISSIRPYTITRSQITYDVRELEKRLKVKHLKAIPVLKAKELDLLEHLIAEAYQGWERSKEPGKSIKQEDFKGESGGGTKTTKTQEGRDGDPAFLNTIAKLIERRDKILGIDAVIKTEMDITGKVEHSMDMEKLRLAYRKRVEIDLMTSGQIPHKTAQLPPPEIIIKNS